MKFQVTFEFDVDVETTEEALNYAKEVASEETLTTGELVTVVQGSLTVNEPRHKPNGDTQ
jgi:hypothetical protein